MGHLALFLGTFRGWTLHQRMTMTDLERTYLDGINRIAEIEKSFSDIRLFLEDNYRRITALDARTEGQYEMLSKRLDAAAHEVMKVKTRLKKLEEENDG